MKSYIVIILVLAVATTLLAYLAFSTPPSKAEADAYLAAHPCPPAPLAADPFYDNLCAQNLIRHTTVIFGRLAWMPGYVTALLPRPFSYFDYIDPATNKPHTYVMLATSDRGEVVYDPVTGAYQGRKGQVGLGRKG